MAIIIISFPGAPKINLEEIEKDEKFNQELKKTIKGISKEEFINYDVDLLLEKILKDFSDKLPPGGGVQSKYINFNFIILF
jgi:protein phosphatase 1B